MSAGVAGERRGRPPQLRRVRARDFDAAFAAHDPRTEWRTALDEPDSQTYRGIDGLHEFVAAISELWLDRFGGAQRFEAFIDLGDWVVVPWSARLRGRTSGIEVLVNETYAVLLSRGKIVRVEEYRTKEEALEAVRRRALPGGDGGS